MAALTCQQVAFIFTTCVVQGLASRHQFQMGVEKAAPSPPMAAPAGAPQGSPGPAAGPAGPCECRFEDFCTCGGALAYLDCISQTCAKEECNCGNNTEKFSTSCGHMASECKSELDIICSSSHATCEGKYNQAVDGIIGLTMDFDKIQGEAYCGPTGRCAGTVQAAVKVHKPAKGVRLSCALEPRQGNSLVLQQSNFRGKPEGAIHLARVGRTVAEREETESAKVTKRHKKTSKKEDNDEKDEDSEKSEEAMKEDEMQGSPGPSPAPAIGTQEHFGVTGLEAHEKGLLTCATEVESDEATCTMDMPPRLKPEGDIEGLCRLVEDATSTIITKDAWFVIKNAYNAPKAEPKRKMAEARSGSAILSSSSLSMAFAILSAAVML